MGDFIDGPGGPDAEDNPAVGRVEGQRDRGQQQRTGPPPDRPQDGSRGENGESLMRTA
jgi:hypothetical protein